MHALGPAISQAEQQRALRRPPESLSAWEAYQRALSHWSVAGDLNIAVEFLHRAVTLDPRFAPSHAMLACAIYSEIALGGQDFAEGLREADIRARTAIELDRRERHGTFCLGLGSVAPGRGLKPALDEAEIAITLNPNDPQGHVVKGVSSCSPAALPRHGDGLTTALRLDPRGPTASCDGPHPQSNYFEHDYRAAEGMARPDRASLSEVGSTSTLAGCGAWPARPDRGGPQDAGCRCSRVAIPTSNSLLNAGRPTIIVQRTTITCLMASAKPAGKADARPAHAAVARGMGV